MTRIFFVRVEPVVFRRSKIASRGQRDTALRFLAITRSEILVPLVDSSSVPQSRRIRLKGDQVRPVGSAETTRGSSGITVREHSSLLPLTVGPWGLPIRVPQEVGRSDQGSGCPFLFWGGLFRCNGQLKTIQTDDTTGSFDELPSLPFFSCPSVFEVFRLKNPLFAYWTTSDWIS